jgi:hypothetical protein
VQESGSPDDLQVGSFHLRQALRQGQDALDMVEAVHRIILRVPGPGIR